MWHIPCYTVEGILGSGYFLHVQHMVHLQLSLASKLLLYCKHSAIAWTNAVTEIHHETAQRHRYTTHEKRATAQHNSTFRVYACTSRYLWIPVRGEAPKSPSPGALWHRLQASSTRFRGRTISRRSLQFARRRSRLAAPPPGVGPVTVHPPTRPGLEETSISRVTSPMSPYPSIPEYQASEAGQSLLVPRIRWV